MYGSGDKFDLESESIDMCTPLYLVSPKTIDTVQFCRHRSLCIFKRREVTSASVRPRGSQGDSTVLIFEDTKNNDTGDTKVLGSIPGLEVCNGDVKPTASLFLYEDRNSCTGFATSLVIGLD